MSTRALAAVVVLTIAGACVSPADGDPEAFCTEVRRSAPSLLDATAPDPSAPEVKRTASELHEHVPESLVDDVEVLAKSDDPGELRESLENVRGYALSACAAAGVQ